jgi:hypothetical protein
MSGASLLGVQSCATRVAQVVERKTRNRPCAQSTGRARPPAESDGGGREDAPTRSGAPRAPVVAFAERPLWLRCLSHNQTVGNVHWTFPRRSSGRSPTVVAA